MKKYDYCDWITINLTKEEAENLFQYDAENLSYLLENPEEDVYIRFHREKNIYNFHWEADGIDEPTGIETWKEFKRFLDENEIEESRYNFE